MPFAVVEIGYKLMLPCHHPTFHYDGPYSILVGAELCARQALRIWSAHEWGNVELNKQGQGLRTDCADAENDQAQGV